MATHSLGALRSLDAPHSLGPGGTDGTVPVLHLFGGPYVTFGGGRRDVPEGSKRLLVYVALQRGRVERRSAAGALWPVGDDVRASGTCARRCGGCARPG